MGTIEGFIIDRYQYHNIWDVMEQHPDLDDRLIPQLRLTRPANWQRKRPHTHLDNYRVDEPYAGIGPDYSVKFVEAQPTSLVLVALSLGDKEVLSYVGRINRSILYTPRIDSRLEPDRTKQSFADRLVKDLQQFECASQGLASRVLVFGGSLSNHRMHGDDFDGQMSYDMLLTFAQNRVRKTLRLEAEVFTPPTASKEPTQLYVSNQTAKIVELTPQKKIPLIEDLNSLGQLFNEILPTLFLSREEAQRRKPKA